MDSNSNRNCFLCVLLASFWRLATGWCLTKNSILCSDRWTCGAAETHVSAVSERTEDSGSEWRPGLETAAAWTDAAVRCHRYDSTDHAELAAWLRRHVLESLHAADIWRVPPHKQEPPVQWHHGTLHWREAWSWKDAEDCFLAWTCGAAETAAGFQFLIICWWWFFITLGIWICEFYNFIKLTFFQILECQRIL